MTKIMVYDDTAERLEEEADKRCTSVEELIDMLMDFLEEI